VSVLLKLQQTDSCDGLTERQCKGTKFSWQMQEKRQEFKKIMGAGSV
jgi:hypothetical protein